MEWRCLGLLRASRPFKGSSVSTESVQGSSAGLLRLCSVQEERQRQTQKKRELEREVSASQRVVDESDQVLLGAYGCFKMKSSLNVPVLL